MPPHRTKRDTRNKRSKLQRERDRAELARMALQQFTQHEIAEELHVSRSQVSYDLKQIRIQWQQRAASSMDSIMAEQLAKIDEVERQAWEAWFRSLEPFQRRSQWARADEDGQPVPTTAVVHTDPGAGDVRWMGVIQWCIEQRVRIYGGYARDKSPLNVTVNGLANINVGAMDETELNEEIARLSKIAMEQSHVLDHGGVIDVTATPTPLPPIPAQLPAPGGATNG